MWVTSRFLVIDGWRFMWFLDSERQYPADPSRPLFSATEIRQLLGTSSRKQIYDKVKDMVLSSWLLLHMLRLKYVDTRRTEAESSQVSETEQPFLK